VEAGSSGKLTDETMSTIRYRIGTSGWVYPHWKERFYPRDLPQRRWLEFYSEHFDTVELNNTFYRLPSADAVAQWRGQAPEGFVFAVKANRFLTHITRLRAVEDPLERMMEVFTILRDRLGPVLFQFPESFRRTGENEQRLRTLFGLLPAKPPFVMEFRHASWFIEEIYEVMRDHEVALCMVGDPKRPTDAVVTGRIVYVRFHRPKDGRSRGNFREEELREWADRIRGLARSKTAYLYFNNDANADAVRNALRLRELLGYRLP
jgi:uncharacterized protein YecE (DUF72 family)